MHTATIRQLNQLNQDFYATIAADFSASRNFAWQGWEKLLPLLKKLPKRSQVLDIACGNGRLAKFFHEKNFNFKYTGLDSAQNLLTIAQQDLSELKIESQLINFDFINNYLKFKTINWPLKKQSDLITVFGLTHHLPSHELQKAFFQSLWPLLKDDGLLIVSNWQFASEQRFEKNILNGQKIKENPQINIWQRMRLKKLLKSLESSDYLLDWRRHSQEGQKHGVYRYCHFLTETEMKKLSAETGWQIIEQFLADGKSRELNQYFVLKKRS